LQVLVSSELLWANKKGRQKSLLDGCLARVSSLCDDYYYVVIIVIKKGESKLKKKPVAGAGVFRLMSQKKGRQRSLLGGSLARVTRLLSIIYNEGKKFLKNS